MKNNDWKERLNVVYSTNPDYSYEMEDDGEPRKLPGRSCVFNWIARIEEEK